MEYIVGKPKFKSAVSYTLCCIAWAIALMSFGAWEGIEIFSYTLIIISIVLVLPGISYCELMWKVDQNVLQYTYHDTILVKIKSFYRHVFKNHKLEYQMTLNMNQIDYVAVTYAKIPRAPFGTFGYDILFEVHMNDGSVYTFISLPLMGREAFNEAVAFMQKQNIRFIDKYEILKSLHQKETISYYLEQMEKENPHD